MGQLIHNRKAMEVFRRELRKIQRLLKLYFGNEYEVAS